MNKQAENLNENIKKNNPKILSLLSTKGKNIFFPKSGIMAQSFDAKGSKINATIGAAVEDDGTPMRLPSIEKNVNLEPQDVFPYAGSYGLLELRKAWLELVKVKNPSLKSNTSLPIVTNALTHGLSIVGYLFVDDGDSIILPDMFWGNYKLIFSSAYGANLTTFNTFKNGGLDIDSFKETLNSQTDKTIVLLNFPNNPAGYTPTESEANLIIEALKEHAKDHQTIVICDDAYFGLVYEEGVYGESLFSRLSDMSENLLAIKVDGATKEDYAWGLRVGFLTYAYKGMDDLAATALEDKTAGAIRGNISNVSRLSQTLVNNAFSSLTYKEEKAEKFEILKKRYCKVKEVILQEKYSDCFEVMPFNSGYFICVRMKTDAEQVRKRLLSEFSTGVIVMGDIIRIAYSGVQEEYIETLFDNILACSR